MEHVQGVVQLLIKLVHQLMVESVCCHGVNWPTLSCEHRCSKVGMRSDTCIVHIAGRRIVVRVSHYVSNMGLVVSLHQW